jgi:hypothetical protein
VRREMRQVDPPPLEHFVQQGEQQIDVGAGPDAEVSSAIAADSVRRGRS